MLFALIVARAGLVSATPPSEAQGNFDATTQVSPKAGGLSLKTGFAVRWGARANRPSGPARLTISRTRAESVHIAPGFVPIGPTAQLVGFAEAVEVSFVAERFRVRAGHRLVLAVLRQPDFVCMRDGPCGGWQLLPARYESMRCVVEGVKATGPMQFGSVPITASDSAAP